MKKIYFIAEAGDGLITKLYDVENKKIIFINEHPALKQINAPLGVGVWKDYPGKSGFLIAEELIVALEPYSHVIDVLGDYPYHTQNNEHPDYPEKLILTLNEIWIAGNDVSLALGAFGQPTTYGTMDKDIQKFF